MLSPVFDTVEHGSVFEHIGEDDKDDFGSTHVNLWTFSFDAMDISNDSVLDVQIHLIFRFK